MLIVISPAKKLNCEYISPYKKHTQPNFLANSAELIDILREKTPAQLSALMSISEKLAVLNAGRYLNWQIPFSLENAKQALFAFTGDVYVGLDARSLKEQEIDYLQQHLRILSGLYGILRPLDLIQAYRLEMGTSLVNSAGKNLYDFWRKIIAEALNSYFYTQQDNILLNLASKEYFNAIDPSLINAQIITPAFYDKKGQDYKVVSFFAKKARGLMVRWIAQNNVQSPEQLKDFDCNGYKFEASLSSTSVLIFRRD